MPNIANLDFEPLSVKGDNYLQWALDIEISLGAKGLEDCIVEGNESSKKDNAKALMMIRHHIEESLKAQYLTVNNPYELWKELKSRYDHQKTVILPEAIYEWTHLRIQDFKQKGFKTYSALIACLLLAEQNNELLMKNNDLRPPGTKHVPDAHHASKETKNNSEANHVQHDQRGRGSSFGRGRGRGGQWRGRGRGGYGRGRYNPYERPNQFSNGRGRGRGSGSTSRQQNSGNSVCHRCGVSNHWAKNCQTPKHLVDLYQESIKGKNLEAHMVYKDGEEDFDHDKDDLMDYETSDILKNDQVD
ncbi:uncharacterized protein LOC130503259 [Raphanus sativus]|uniref:Uncharacterized protein LOC130503259 n=1 Tax=Raphanus sativus TaxID=3726 RepID=A0A9W3CR10_RAPSA|nr:uncharacterized protein LOC130503259 [Raphanus sativus]